MFQRTISTERAPVRPRAIKSTGTTDLPVDGKIPIRFRKNKNLPERAHLGFMRKGTRFLLIVFLQVAKTQAAIFGTAEDDYVDFLPEFGRPPTSQFSGYLDATPGCDTSRNGNFCHVHYWLSFADEAPEEKPLILWLNGGPGSSSVIGYLQENGPLLLSWNGTLIKNPYSWTKVANYLIFESPLGVGYSYCENQSRGKICDNTDRWTARLNLAALLDLYRKFPQFVDNDLFLTGESYAGVYIPTLAYKILEYNANNQNNKDQRPIPLRGLAVGDPCTDNESQRESMDPLWYAHKYGLVDDDVYDLLTNACDGNQEFIPNHQYPRQHAHGHHDTHNNYDSPECRLALRKYLLSSSHGILNTRKWNESFIDRYSLYAYVTSVTDIAMNTYMNRDDVRRALHVHSAPVDTWPRTSLGWQYTKEYAACNVGSDSNLSMINFYRKIVPRLERTWIYNGDTDPCVSYEGTRTAVRRFGFREIDGGGYRPWFYNHTAAPLDFIENKAPLFGPNLAPISLGAQFGGEFVQYEHSLSFLTVHGSGHMVPQFRPQAALHMISKFVSFDNLTPLWPTDATLAKVNATGFKTLLEEWTESAKTAPYVT
jgi:cathepsin A (carboxypeptidase C)